MQGNFGVSVTKGLLQEYVKDADRTFYRSNFRFINEHKGYRPQSTHLFVGAKGGGKSTLARSLMIDILEHGHKMLVWLSEETQEEYFGELQRSGFEVDFNLLSAYSEQEKNSSTLFEELCEHIEKNQIKFIFFDNITTSKWYGLTSNQQQAESADRLKTLVNKTGVIAIIFAHTKSSISDNYDRIVDDTDIRGNTSIVNMSQFTYTMQRIFQNNLIVPTIKIGKSRSQNIKNRIFKLEFHEKFRMYACDRPIDFNDFKNMFKERNKV